MKNHVTCRRAKYFWSVVLVIAALPLARAQTSSYPPQLDRFTAAKERQESQLADDLHVPLLSEVKAFFKAAHAGDYPAMSNTVDRLGGQLAGGYDRLTNGAAPWLPFWQPMTEIESAYEPFAHGGSKYPLAFANGIISSIPAGSIYFGGTDSGRMLVTAFCASHAEGKPFYTITQNALSDPHYMTYVRSMYSKYIQLPTTNDVQKAIDEYKADAIQRSRQGRLKPGEIVHEGEVDLNAVTVMEIHARIVKWILDHNPKQEFYYEESYPLELLYPYLSPHGLIFKIDHEARPPLLASEIQADETFWTKQVDAMLGEGLSRATSVSNLCAFVEKVYLRKDLSGFKGDREFVTSDFAQKAFSKLRVSIAGLYQWRLMHEDRPDMKELKASGDYAFRQAYVLCPTSAEATFRYVNFLMMERRLDDAILLVNTTLKLTPAADPSRQSLEGLWGNLQQYQQQQRRMGI